MYENIMFLKFEGREGVSPTCRFVSEGISNIINHSFSAGNLIDSSYKCHKVC